jgi:hypothetical protein
MKSNDRPQSKERSDYSSLFISAILLITVSAATEGLATLVSQLIRGVLVGMSIA